ncbi:putative elongation factor 1-delta isoform X3 [Megalopta genalis]|uniref:putative elongation factor 1-delta isoform X3 n=1 Tax=Megalopta genalis TaxID=115081 RepID=UPI003FD16622
MEKLALAQEKVWFDKPSYDKAERLYFEKMAKMVNKLMERCPYNNLPQPKTKPGKTKDNILLSSENIPNDNLKNYETNKSKSNKYENEYNTQKNENLEEKQRSDDIKNDIKMNDINSSYDMSIKYNMEEGKEKKNEAKTKHANRGKEKNDTIKTNLYSKYLPPHIRKEQQWIQENQQTTSPNFYAGGSLAHEVAKAHQYVRESLQCMDNIAVFTGLIEPPKKGKENVDEAAIEGLLTAISSLEKRVKYLEDTFSQFSIQKSDPSPKEPKKKPDDDNDTDLFKSDSEAKDAEAAKIREERLAAYTAKKSKKPVLIAKSNIILDVKPWGSEVDMKEMETEVRKIETDGLLWGAAKLVPLAYGIHKLQISCVVEDEKVSVDWLTEEIQQIEEHVQSVDIAAFNKV